MTRDYPKFHPGKTSKVARKTQSLPANYPEKQNLQEKLLPESEEMYRLILGSSSESFFITDIAGVFTFISPNVESFFGYCTSEIQEFYNIAHLLGDNLFEWQDLQTRGEILNIERKIIDKTGNPRVLLINVKQVSLNGGSVLYCCRDITKRKRLEEARRDSDCQLRAFFEGALDAILVADDEGRYVEANPAACKLFGLSQAELLGCRISDFAELGFDFNQVWRSFLEQREVKGEFSLMRADGEVRVVDYAATANFLPHLHLSVLRDITQRKQMEAELVTLNNQLEQRVKERTAELSRANHVLEQEIRERKQAEATRQEQEAILQSFYNSSPMMMGVVELLEDDILHLSDNQTTAQFFGTSTAAMQNKLASQMGSLPTNLRQWISNYRQSELTRTPVCFEYQHQSGIDYKWLSATVCFIGKAANGRSRFSYIVEEITQRKHTEEALLTLTKREREKAQQLEIALKELQSTQVMLVQNEKMVSLGQLVAGIAHEINNPVSFIYGNIYPAREYAQNLLQLLQLYQQQYSQPESEIIEQQEILDIDFIAEDFPKLLESMQEGADRIHQIVQSLRNFSRFDEKTVKRADLHEGIDNTLLILEHRLKPQSRFCEIQVIKDYGQLPLVECYLGQLNQVFMNLLGNAIDSLEELRLERVKVTGSADKLQTIQDYSKNPCICIRTEVLEKSRLAIRIADNGPGIAVAIQPRIFDPFFTTKPPGKGTGLGLSISYRIIVNQHGGKLECHSVEGQGTEFVIELPLTQNSLDAS
ncbi:PAS domain S-box protein [Lyngbya aestuarii]|uniref:PAS domain S-box protein n=1 Tax=Lyngbya aestuarii TaxID=118322 RepID=UPI00403E2D22